VKSIPVKKPGASQFINYGPYEYVPLTPAGKTHLLTIGKTELYFFLYAQVQLVLP
jgi:hypothetical protein